MFFSHVNFQVWKTQDGVMHFSSIVKLSLNRVPPHPASSLFALMASLICLPVMSSEFLNFVIV